jgi:uncharacterized membrane protein YGL010W
MALIKLNNEWTELLASYRADHQHPTNIKCHNIGIPLIAGSLPVAATVVGLPVAGAMFTIGWGFQFAGHVVEGKKPSFVADKRALVVGLLWWLQKMGMTIEETPLVS